MIRGMVLGAACVLAALAGPARADLPDEIQVYDDSFNPRGVFGVELHVNHTIDGNTTPSYPGEVTTGGATRLTPEFSYGLGNGFEAGLYLNSLIEKSGTPRFAGAKLRMKYIIHPAPDGGVFYGVNVELGFIGRDFDIGKTALELKPIAGWRHGGWLAIINPNIEFTLAGPQKSATPALSPAVKLGRGVVRGIMLGVEAYRDLGTFNGFAPVGRQDTQLFGVIDFDRKPFVFNFGIGRGFTGADPVTVKAIFELPF